MPLVTGLGDFAYQNRRDKVNDKNTTIDQILRAAGLAKDVWTTYQGHQWQQDALKAGSPEDLAYQRKLQQDLQNNKDWLSYQNANPNKPADQLYDEWLQTPEGQAFQADQEKRKNAALGLEHGYRMSEIGASQNVQDKKSQLKAQLSDYLQNTLPMMHPDTVTADATGNPILNLDKRKDIVKYVLSWFKDASPTEQSWLTQMLDENWSGNSVPAQTGQGAPTGIDIGKITSTIGELAQTITGPSPTRTNSASLNAPNSWAQAEKSLEGDLTVLDSNPSLTPDEKQAVEYAFKQSSRPGELDNTTFDQIYRFVQALKQKYQTAPINRPGY